MLINCMADTGADRDVIGEQTIKRLNIGTKDADLKVGTVDNEIVSKRKLASFSIESLDGDYHAEVNEAL